MYEYTLIRSRRRTVALHMAPDGRLTVRGPLSLTDEQADSVVASHARWIEKQLVAARNHISRPPLTDSEIASLRQRAIELIPGRVEHFSRLMEVNPTSVKITSAQKRFGSCSAKGALCFSFRLMLYAPQAIDYVVIHELAHLRQFNHSRDFWTLVEKYMPDYLSAKKLLKG